MLDIKLPHHVHLVGSNYIALIVLNFFFSCIELKYLCYENDSFLKEPEDSFL